MSETLRLTLAEIRRMDAETEARAAAAPGQLKPGSTSPHGVAVVGHEGHFFIGDGANRWERQYLGQLKIDASWFAAWRDVLRRRQAEAARRGVVLWNVVVPEKQVVLPEARWPEPPSGERRPFRLLLNHLEAELAAFNVHYCAPDLLSAKPDGPVYLKRNSHWAPAGCCAAVFGLVRKLGVEADLASLRLAYARSWTAHDLPVHFFMDPVSVEAGALRNNGPYLFEHRQVEGGRFTGSRYAIGNPEAPDRRRVLIFGDSYAYDAGMADALSAIFAETIFVWSKEVRWDLVESHRADIVIWESAERFIATTAAH